MFEKIREFIDNYKKSNNKKKIENLVFFLILLIITLLSINIIFKDEQSDESVKNKELVLEESEEIQENDLEKKLSETLEKIQGVGKVKVLITYSETMSIVPIYNESTSKTEAGVENEISIDTKKEVVILNDSEVVIEKNINPKIEGAVIIAEGGNKGEVKEKIIAAVEVTTGLETHKIQVFEMEKNT